jgi:hypothetical protein
LREHPPAPQFSNPHADGVGVLRARICKPRWADGWDPMKYEYAVTASGERSVGGHESFSELIRVGFAERT